MTSLFISLFLTGNIYLQCDDASEFANQYLTEIEEANSWVQRQIELAKKSSNGAIGNKERGFLDDELEAMMDVVRYLFEHAYYEDSFGQDHFHHRNGFEFSVPLELANKKYKYLMDFRFPAVSIYSLGHSAYHRLDLREEAAESPTAPSIQIGSQATYVITTDTDDIVSYEFADRSAIAWAHAINRVSHDTGVYANTLESTLELRDLDDRYLFEQLPSLYAGDLSINGVNIVGASASIVDLIDTINDFSSSTGVRARLDAGSTDDISLYASDARNIIVETNLSPEARSALSLNSSKVVAFGDVELQSVKTIILTGQGDEFFTNFTPAVAVDPRAGYATVDISTQSNAMEALWALEITRDQLFRLMIEADKILKFCR